MTLTRFREGRRGKWLQGLYKVCGTEMWKMKKVVTEIESMIGRRE